MNVLIVCSGNAPGFKFSLHQPFIYDQVEIIKKIKPDCKFYYHFINGKGLKGYLANLKDIRRSIKKNDIDLVHAHFSLSALLSNFQRKVPVVSTFHGSDINLTRLRYISAIVSLLSKANVYVSRQILSKALFTFKKKDYIIPCGVDMEVFRPIETATLKPADEFTILFSSSFDNPVKNFALLDRALHFLRGYAIRVEELSNYARAEVAVLMNKVDLCVLTSFSEGSPQFIKEAMACNCPIVATDVGDVKDVIGQTAGCYVTSFDAEDVANKIRKSILTPGRTNGREFINRFDNIVIGKQIVGLYEKLLSK